MLHKLFGRVPLKTLFLYLSQIDREMKNTCLIFERIFLFASEQKVNTKVLYAVAANCLVRCSRGHC